MGALRGAKDNGAQGVRAITYLAGGLVVAFLLSGCELVERLSEDPPPKKAAAAESQAGEADAAGDEVAEAEAEPATPVATVTASDDPRLILRVPFETGKAELAEESQAELTDLAGSIPGNPSATPEIFAYWSAASEDLSRAKFFALKRGMVVRTFLKERGAVVPRIRLVPVDDPDPNLIDLLRPLP